MEKVTVVMSTFNGQKYIAQQIQSIFNQNDVLVDLWIFDDGSSDQTIEILKEFCLTNSNIHIIKNSKTKGPAQSFLDGLRNVPNSEYFAFSDQDDVWDPDKLSSAISFMTSHDKFIGPKLYFSKARLVDENLRSFGMADYKDGVLSVPEIFTRNNGVGCTFVFNTALREVVIRGCIEFENNEVMHDQWLYAICQLVGGKVYFDKTSHIKYRQHYNNVVGGKNRNILKKAFSSGFLASGNSRRFKFVVSLRRGFYEQATSKNKRLLTTACEYKQNMASRLKWMRSYAISSDNLLHKVEICSLILFGRY